jgi:hypothetical protein
MTTTTTVNLVAPVTIIIGNLVLAAEAMPEGAGAGSDRGIGGLIFIVKVLTVFMAFSIGLTQIAVVGWPDQTIGGWAVARWAEWRQAAKQEKEKKEREKFRREAGRATFGWDQKWLETRAANEVKKGDKKRAKRTAKHDQATGLPARSAARSRSTRGSDIA